MSEFKEQETETFEYTTQGFPPKPIMKERGGNAVMRSLLSLFIYALLFYFLFNDVTYIAAILIVIIIHELGHFLFMRLYNYSNVKIFIFPLLGAFTSGKKQNVSQMQLATIILAGPVPGVIIGSILFYLNLEWKDETVKMLSTTFLYINLLNFLPFYPLDGGRFLETLFFKQNHLLRLVFGIISIMALSFLFFYSPIMLIVPIMVGLELYNETKHQKIRDYLVNEKINYRTDYPNLPDKDYWLIRDCLILSFPKKYPGIPAGNYQYHMAEPVLVQHVNAVLQVNLKNDLSIFQKISLIIFYILIFIAPLVFLIRNI
ncbi:MAG: hypothetical protein IPM51_09770 [Sphingobacteriaceae bacterium]|nr:hypothetical protein [Sphingobacteriaceae bacterium]